MSMVSAGFLR